jgi:hypothetical protein
LAIARSVVHLSLGVPRENHNVTDDYSDTLLAVVGVVIVLLVGFNEPFNGTTAGLVGRMMGAAGIGFAAVSNLLRGRRQIAVLWTGVGVGITGLIVAVLGRVS